MFLYYSQMKLTVKTAYKKHGSFITGNECDVTVDSTIALLISPVLLQAWEVVQTSWEGHGGQMSCGLRVAPLLLQAWEDAWEFVERV
jgi:hypothetical protein